MNASGYKFRLSSIVLTVLLAMQLNAATSFGEDDPIAAEETAAAKGAESPKWDATIQQKYGLTAEQTGELRAKGFKNPQIAILSQLAKSSGKPLADIVKMRLEGKMGWGKIAKELGVSPSEIGHAVSSVRKEMNEARREDRKERRKERKEKKELAQDHGAAHKDSKH